MNPIIGDEAQSVGLNNGNGDGYGNGYGNGNGNGTVSPNRMRRGKYKEQEH